LISGIDGGGGALNNPVVFDQIINNTLIGGVVKAGVDLGSQIFSGFLFQRGGISFADDIDRDSLSLGSDVDSAFTDVAAALSSPDYSGPGEPEDGEFTLSLGTGGQATFRFTDNFLTGSDSATPDLVIFEAGVSESVRVEISRDGENYRFVGNASENKPGTVKEVQTLVLEAGSKRVRPAIMTSATTIIALLPILTSTGKGSDIMVPMAIPLFGGMTIAVLTMFVVPVLYSMWQEGIVKRELKKLKA